MAMITPAKKTRPPVRKADHHDLISEHPCLACRANMWPELVEGPSTGSGHIGSKFEKMLINSASSRASSSM
jgi:hypothetical protein